MNIDVSEPPDDVCGFTLQPEDIGHQTADHPPIDWYEEWGIATCIREPWQNHDACIWHAEVEDKSADALVAARTNEPEHLDGAYVVDANLKHRISFAECRLWWTNLSGTDLQAAYVSEADLSNANLSEANLKSVNLSEANLKAANLSEANLKGAFLPRVNLKGAHLTRANLEGVHLPRANLVHTFLPGANLVDANLLEADLRGAYLPGVDLRSAYLPRVDLRWADLSEAYLRSANLSEANLMYAYLPGVNLGWADLSEANLMHADLSEAFLGSAVLAEVVLGNIDLSAVQMNSRIRFTPRSLRLRLKSIFGLHFRKIGLDSDSWNAHARDAHTLAATCSQEGLIRQARTLTIWDRHARRNEALCKWNILTAFGSWLNWQATGYGISVSRVSRNMLFLFLASTLTYLLYGIEAAEESVPFSDLVSRPFLTESVVNTVYFSVVTFTTSPPGTVSIGVEVSQWMAMVETFLGTLLIVLLGYVLGHREQI